MSKNSEMAGRLTGAILLLALTAGLTGCGKAVEDYSVVGATNEVSQVTSELEFLNMPNVKLVVNQETGKLTVSGMDNIEFLDFYNCEQKP